MLVATPRGGLSGILAVIWTTASIHAALVLEEPDLQTSSYYLLKPDTFKTQLGDDFSWACENIPLFESSNFLEWLTVAQEKPLSRPDIVVPAKEQDTSDGRGLILGTLFESSISRSTMKATTSATTSPSREPVVTSAFDLTYLPSAIRGKALESDQVVTSASEAQSDALSNQGLASTLTYLAVLDPQQISSSATVIICPYPAHLVDYPDQDPSVCGLKVPRGTDQLPELSREFEPTNADGVWNRLEGAAADFGYSCGRVSTKFKGSATDGMIDQSPVTVLDEGEVQQGYFHFVCEDGIDRVRSALLPVLQRIVQRLSLAVTGESSSITAIVDDTNSTFDVRQHTLSGKGFIPEEDGATHGNSKNENDFQSPQQPRDRTKMFYQLIHRFLAADFDAARASFSAVVLPQQPDSEPKLANTECDGKRTDTSTSDGQSASSCSVTSKNTFMKQRGSGFDSGHHSKRTWVPKPVVVPSLEATATAVSQDALWDLILGAGPGSVDHEREGKLKRRLDREQSAFCLNYASWVAVPQDAESSPSSMCNKADGWKPVYGGRALFLRGVKLASPHGVREATVEIFVGSSNGPAMLTDIVIVVPAPTAGSSGIAAGTIEVLAGETADRMDLVLDKSPLPSASDAPEALTLCFPLSRCSGTSARVTAVKANFVSIRFSTSSSNVGAGDRIEIGQVALFGTRYSTADRKNRSSQGDRPEQGKDTGELKQKVLTDSCKHTTLKDSAAAAVACLLDVARDRSCRRREQFNSMFQTKVVEEAHAVVSDSFSNFTEKELTTEFVVAAHPTAGLLYKVETEAGSNPLTTLSPESSKASLLSESWSAPIGVKTACFSVILRQPMLVTGFHLNGVLARKTAVVLVTDSVGYSAGAAPGVSVATALHIGNNRLGDPFDSVALSSRLVPVLADPPFEAAQAPFTEVTYTLKEASAARIVLVTLRSTNESNASDVFVPENEGRLRMGRLRVIGSPIEEEVAIIKKENPLRDVPSLTQAQTKDINRAEDQKGSMLRPNCVEQKTRDDTCDRRGVWRRRSLTNEAICDDEVKFLTPGDGGHLPPLFPSAQTTYSYGKLQLMLRTEVGVRGISFELGPCFSRRLRWGPWIRYTFTALDGVTQVNKGTVKLPLTLDSVRVFYSLQEPVFAAGAIFEIAEIDDSQLAWPGLDEFSEIQPALW